MKMKQTFILLSALCAAVLVGCGGKGDSAQNGENGNNGGKQWKTASIGWQIQCDEIKQAVAAK